MPYTTNRIEVCYMCLNSCNPSNVLWNGMIYISIPSKITIQDFEDQFDFAEMRELVRPPMSAEGHKRMDKMIEDEFKRRSPLIKKKKGIMNYRKRK